jgi:hypothetical protein
MMKTLQIFMQVGIDHLINDSHVHWSFDVGSIDW